MEPMQLMVAQMSPTCCGRKDWSVLKRSTHRACDDFELEMLIDPSQGCLCLCTRADYDDLERVHQQRRRQAWKS